jgi:hypothetical protein
VTRHSARLVRVIGAVLLALAIAPDALAQRGGRGATPPPREAAAIDLTGYWVSVVTEDWRLRMVTPGRGVYDAIPLTSEARTVADAWDPAGDEAHGEQCRAYGAAAIMRMPGRLHITWQDDRTLRIDTDAGSQTRLLHFGSEAAAGERSWQGHSLAEWQYGSGARGAARTGTLKVITTHLRPGYLRRNGVPYSEDARLTEYFDVHTMPNGDRWLTVTTRVDDPRYLTRPYLTTSDFKKLADATGWSPSSCFAG